MRSGLVHSVLRATGVLLCVAAAPLLVLALIRWFYGVPLSAFRPFLSDEVWYWHQTLTFAAVGFRGGYYSLGELTNSSGFTPFGPHGPGFIVLYGSLGAAFGWYRHSPVVLNLLAISIATWAWSRLAPLSGPRLLLSTGLLVTFWPMIFWAPTGLQEALHQAGAIALAGFFAHSLGPAPRTGVQVAGWLTLAALAFIRPTWLVLLPLWAFATTHRRARRTLFITLAGSVALAALLLWSYSRSTAPFPTGFFFLRVLDLSVGAGAIRNNLRFNLYRTIDLGEYEFLEVLLRFQYWGWLIAALTILVIGRRRRRLAPSGVHLPIAAIAASVALALMLLLYTLTNWAEHRVLSPFLLFVSLLCVAAPAKTAPLLAVAVLATNVASTKPFLDAFNAERADNFVWDRRGSYELADAIQGRIAYRADQPRWCNTLLTSQFPPHLIAVPAGIGLSVVREANEMALPPRSHYILLDELARADFSGPIHIMELAKLPYGTLYRNLESGCE